MRGAYRGGVAIVAAVVVLASVTPVGLVGTAAAATLTVDDSGGADYTSIQAAVDAASAGDTIQVASGTYAESVVVGKPLTIVGDPGDATAGSGPNAPVIAGGPGAIGFKIRASADDTTITGFEFRDYSDAGVSVEVRGAQTLTNFELSQSRFVNAELEFELRGASPMAIDGATISGNRFVDTEGFDLDGSGLDGVTISEFVFEENVLDSSSGDAVDIDLRSTNTDVTMVLRGNTIRDSAVDGIEFELHPDETYDLTIESNVIDGSGSEAVEFLENGGAGLTAHILTNDFRNSGGSALHVHDGDASGIVVQHNNIVGNANGIRNDGTGDLDARYNYWGSSDGPVGDQLPDSTTVLFTPFATEPIDSSEDYDIESAGDTSTSGGSDIEIHDATFSPADPVVGEEVTISVEVANDGTKTGYVTGMFRSDFTPHETFDVTVAPGETRTVSTTVVYEDAEQYNVYFADEYVGTVDVGTRGPMNVIVEADPANNTVDATVENPRRTAIDIPVPPVDATNDSGVVLTNVAVTPTTIDDFQLGITQSAYENATTTNDTNASARMLPDGTAPVSAISFDSSLENDRVESVQLTFTVNVSRYPSLADTAVGDPISLYRYDASTDTYTQMPGEVVEAGNGSITATVTLEGFSTYLLGVDRAAFDVHSSVAGNPVTAGDALALEVDVTNTGDGVGTYTPDVTVAGEPVETGSLVLAASASDTLVVEVPTSAVGVWPITIDGRFVAVAVVEPADDER